MKKARNWIEKQTGKRMVWSPVFVGTKGGRDVYAIMFENGTEEDYIIDYDSRTLERL